MRLVLALTVSLGLVALLVWAVLTRPEPVVDLPAQLAQAMPDSGVNHEVTAVLLNFRGYDTLVEVAVLILAIVGGLALCQKLPDAGSKRSLDSPLLAALVSWLVPVMIVVAGYLLWAGSHRPGGAFQAGAVLAAAGVLLRLSGVVMPAMVADRKLWLGLVAGFVVFLGVGSGVMSEQRSFLTYPVGQAKPLILVIEAFLSLSIGLILLKLFDAAPKPLKNSSGGRRDEH